MKLSYLFVLACLFAMLPNAGAAEIPSFELVIKDHKFIPDHLQVPSGVKIRLVVKNQDPTPEEFESYALNREKVIPGNAQALIYIGPLEPGVYPFFGEFNQKSAQGKITAE